MKLTLQNAGIFFIQQVMHKHEVIREEKGYRSEYFIHINAYPMNWHRRNE